MEIRRGTLQDFRKVVQLLRMVFPQDEVGYYWSFLRFDPFFRPEDVWFMEEKGEVVSCLWVLRRFFSDGEQFFLAGGVANVVTHPAFRGRGFASQLLESVINVARKEELSFLVLVTDIPSFYERFGFKDCKKWVSQVEPGEGKSIELAKPQTGEILESYRTFYQKRRLLTPVRNCTYLRGMRWWNRYSAGFKTGKEVAFWGKGEGEIEYFLNFTFRRQTISSEEIIAPLQT